MCCCRDTGVIITIVFVMVITMMRPSLSSKLFTTRRNNFFKTYSTVLRAHPWRALLLSEVSSASHANTNASREGSSSQLVPSEDERVWGKCSISPFALFVGVLEHRRRSPVSPLPVHRPRLPGCVIQSSTSGRARTLRISGGTIRALCNSNLAPIYCVSGHSCACV